MEVLEERIKKSTISKVRLKWTTLKVGIIIVQGNLHIFQFQRLGNRQFYTSIHINTTIWRHAKN